MSTTITIPKNFIHGDELIVVRRKDYEGLQKHLSEVRDAMEKIRRGEKEYREGKTIAVKSLSELRKQK
jgi:hypothetical protein